MEKVGAEIRLTPFDTLDADCRLVAGHISCQMFNMQTRRGLVSGNGDVDLGQQTLDWNLSVASHVVPMKASQTSAGPHASRVDTRILVAADDPTGGPAHSRRGIAADEPDRGSVAALTWR